MRSPRKDPPRTQPPNPPATPSSVADAIVSVLRLGDWAWIQAQGERGISVSVQAAARACKCLKAMGISVRVSVLFVQFPTLAMVLKMQRDSGREGTYVYVNSQEMLLLLAL